jgi:subtilase family serine protease
MNLEETGDVEFVHAMAPDAKILLVITASHTNLDGFSYVIDHNAADIATTSWYAYYWDTGDGSSAKTVRSFNDKYANSVKEKITLITASGDSGSDETLTGMAGPGEGDSWQKHLPYAYTFPDYSPWVTQVGGTVLTLQSGKYSETGWKGSAGGPSRLFPEPDWQTGPGVPQNHARNMPDIALNAACETPYAVYFNGSSGNMCGTSASAPTFAGIIADIEQAAGQRLGFLNPTLYSLASSDPSVYHEITSGCSLRQPNPNDKATKTGYCAGPGWNFVTGWGSIDAARLATHLAPRAHIIAATTTTTTSREHLTETTPIIRRSQTENVANTNLTNRKAFEYSPYLLAGLVIAALIIVGFTYAKKHKTKNNSN